MPNEIGLMSREAATSPLVERIPLGSAFKSRSPWEFKASAVESDSWRGDFQRLIDGKTLQILHESQMSSFAVAPSGSPARQV